MINIKGTIDGRRIREKVKFENCKEQLHIDVDYTPFSTAFYIVVIYTG
jgi:hypothetical protein